MFSNFEDLVKNNRSCRGYDANYTVSLDELKDMVNCARLTASSCSIQPLKYRLVVADSACEVNEAPSSCAASVATDSTATDEVAIVNNNIVFAANLPGEKLPYPGTEPRAFIIVCQDLEIYEDKNRFLKDVGIVAQTILLRATEMGLAGCMVGNFNKQKLPEELGIPERYYPLLVISIGKSIEDIRLVEIEEGDSAIYYRKDGIHYAPKRKLEDVII